VARIDELAEQIEFALDNGQPVPLTPQIRLDRRTVKKFVQQLRQEREPAGELAELVDLLESAKAVPLTGQVRLDPEPIRALLERIRTAAAG
jgi:hypothetical protein